MAALTYPEFLSFLMVVCCRQYVREVSQFDLTCPIRGVGPGVIRKLLLEDNLKVRGRKDSKVSKPGAPCSEMGDLSSVLSYCFLVVTQLELVALLFSDVLLLTKVQKKAERLKVVRPPLALDRMYCYTLKDGCEYRSAAVRTTEPCLLN